MSILIFNHVNEFLLSIDKVLLLILQPQGLHWSPSHWIESHWVPFYIVESVFGEYNGQYLLGPSLIKRIFNWI